MSSSSGEYCRDLLLANRKTLLYCLIPLSFLTFFSTVGYTYGISELKKTAVGSFKKFKADYLKREQQLIVKDSVIPYVKKQIDEIVIDSYECSKCDQDARDHIFLPCKHCYLCQLCYEKEPEKEKCSKCQSKVKEVMKVYVSNYE